MAEITQNQLSQLHGAGKPLSSAWLHYASAEDKARWNGLQKQSAAASLSEGVATAQSTEGDVLTKLTLAFQGAQTILTARGALRTKLQAHILSYVENGHLHGFGYELPRHKVSTPVAIPTFAWAGKCDWDAGTLSHQGLQFVDIRLTHDNTRKDILGQESPEYLRTRHIGRPTAAQDIQDAIEGLFKAGEVDVTASQYSHFRKLRRWLGEHRPNLSPPPNTISDETLRRQFAPFFSALKKNTKQKF